MSAMPAKRDIVINTGPLLALAAAGRLDVLSILFNRILVSAEVGQEIAAGGQTQFAVQDIAAATWLEKRTEATPLTPFLTSALDPGEASVIALAMAEKIPTVCIDETSGRRLARLHGLSVTGSLGILIQAKQQGVPVKLRDTIKAMRERGIWISNALVAECLRLAQEPSEAEVQFAKLRRRIQNAISTFLSEAQSSLNLNFNFAGGNLESLAGSIQPNTLADQVLNIKSTYRRTDGSIFIFDAGIGHMKGWIAIVTVTTSETQPQQVIFDGDEDLAMKKLKEVIVECLKRC